MFVEMIQADVIVGEISCWQRFRNFQDFFPFSPNSKIYLLKNIENMLSNTILKKQRACSPLSEEIGFGVYDTSFPNANYG